LKKFWTDTQTERQTDTSVYIKVSSLAVCVVVSSLGGYPYCRDSHSYHIDVTDVTLVTDVDDAGNGCRRFGIHVDSVDHSGDGFLHPPFISRLEPGSVAERLVSGILA